MCDVTSVGEKGRRKEGGGTARSFHEELWPMEYELEKARVRLQYPGFVWGQFPLHCSCATELPWTLG